MLAAVPRGLLAVRTGAVSGLVCVDIDPRDGGRLDPGLMPETALISTGGADHGWHLLYAHPGGYVPSRKLAGYPGVDVKGDGGYVVMPPSAHPVTGRAYRWVGERPVREMHPALISRCQAPTPVPPPLVPALTPATHGGQARPGRPIRLPGGGCISAPDALLAAHLNAVAKAPVGRRRRTLYGAARGIARLVAAGAITPDHARDVLDAAGLAAGQSPAQTRNAIHSAFTAEGVPTPYPKAS